MNCCWDARTHFQSAVNETSIMMITCELGETDGGGRLRRTFLHRRVYFKHMLLTTSQHRRHVAELPVNTRSNSFFISTGLSTWFTHFWDILRGLEWSEHPNRAASQRRQIYFQVLTALFPCFFYNKDVANRTGSIPAPWKMGFKQNLKAVKAVSFSISCLHCVLQCLWGFMLFTTSVKKWFGQTGRGCMSEKGNFLIHGILHAELIKYKKKKNLKPLKPSLTVLIKCRMSWRAHSLCVFTCWTVWGTYRHEFP